jgi:hypothetical protein
MRGKAARRCPVAANRRDTAVRLIHVKDEMIWLPESAGTSQTRLTGASCRRFEQRRETS